MSAETPSKSILDMPEVPRVLPFLVFLIIGSFAGRYFAGSEYWLYAVKTLAGAGLIWFFRRALTELKWAVSWEAVVVGLVIAVLWIGLDGRVPSLGDLYDQANKLITGKEPKPVEPEKPWNPIAFFEGNPALAWGFVAVRVIGRSLVVPMIEEVFYRSFFYRYISKPDFLGVPLNAWNSVAFLVTCAAFGLAHPGQWLAGIICAAAYQWLVLHKNRLGDAMTAHAITNLVISVYAISQGKWQFT
jgi:uncharacterized protein